MIIYQIKRFYRLYGSLVTLRSFLRKLKLNYFKKDLEDAVTIIITSSGRRDYLKITVDSLKYHLHTSRKVYWHIIDDNPDSEETRKYIRSQNFDKVILNSKNRGLGHSLNLIYSTIQTKYIFHCEDDWEFLENIFADKLIEELESTSEDKQLVLNRKEPYKITPIIEDNKALVIRYYSFNPHFLKFSLLQKLLPFSKMNTERTLSDRMRKKRVHSQIYGYKEKVYVSHIGKIRTTLKY